MLSLTRATEIAPGGSLHLRYGVFVHAGMPESAALDARWKDFAGSDLHPPLAPKDERDCLNGRHRLFNLPHTFRTVRECQEAVRERR